MCNDNHDCPTATGDSWLKAKLDGYVQWAKTHNSLLILTWDEDGSRRDNHIATIMVGARVNPGNYNTTINHYTVLRTVQDGAVDERAPVVGGADDAHVAIGREVPVVEDVEGVGEGALWSNTTVTLLVKKGHSVLSIALNCMDTPHDNLSKAIEVAEVALKKM